MNDPNIGYVNWCFCAACLVPGICGNGKCEVVQNGTLVSSFKCVCDPGYANILNMTAGYCANQCKFVLSGFCLFEYSQRILHHSILSYVKLFLWYDCTRIIWMDYMLLFYFFALVTTPGVGFAQILSTAGIAWIDLK